MTVVNPPTWLDGQTYSSASDRDLLATLLAPGAAYQSALGGVRPSPGNLGLSVQPAIPANDTIVIPAGSVFVPSASGHGVYVCHSTGSEVRSVAPASLTQSRIDLVVAQVNDPAFGGDATWDIVVITGVSSSGTPAVPAVPTNAWPLAQILVSAAGTTVISSDKITDRRGPKAASLGGLVVADSTSLPANPHPGMPLYSPNDDTVRLWNAPGGPGAGSGGVWGKVHPTALPGPVRAWTGTAQTITASAFANLPTVRIRPSVTLPKPALVHVQYSAWLSLSGLSVRSADLRVAVNASGATTFAALSTSEGAVSWPIALYEQGDAADKDKFSQHSNGFYTVLNAGQTFIEMQSYRIIGGTSGTVPTTQVFYPIIELTPIRYL